MAARDFIFDDQDVYGNRLRQGPTSDPASGNPRPRGAANVGPRAVGRPPLAGAFGTGPGDSVDEFERKVNTGLSNTAAAFVRPAGPVTTSRPVANVSSRAVGAAAVPQAFAGPGDSVEEFERKVNSALERGAGSVRNAVRGAVDGARSFLSTPAGNSSAYPDPEAAFTSGAYPQAPAPAQEQPQSRTEPPSRSPAAFAAQPATPAAADNVPSVTARPAADWWAERLAPAAAAVADVANYPIAEQGALAFMVPKAKEVAGKVGQAVKAAANYPIAEPGALKGMFGSGDTANEVDISADAVNTTDNTAGAVPGVPFGQGAVNTIDAGASPFVSANSMANPAYRDQVYARDAQLRREGNAHLASDASELDVQRHRDFLRQKESSAEKLERSELERQLGNINISGNQSVGSLIGNRAKARQIERKLAAFDNKSAGTKDREAKAVENALDRQADLAAEAFKAQADLRTPKVGATLERVRSKMVNQGFGALSEEEKVLVTEDLRKAALESLQEDLNPPKDADGNPLPITPERVEERMQVMLGKLGAGQPTPYTGDAPPANAPGAIRAKDGAWYVPAQANTPGARKAKDGNYYAPVTQ